MFLMQIRPELYNIKLPFIGIFGFPSLDATLLLLTFIKLLQSTYISKQIDGFVEVERGS